MEKTPQFWAAYEAVADKVLKDYLEETEKRIQAEVDALLDGMSYKQTERWMRSKAGQRWLNSTDVDQGPEDALTSKLDAAYKALEATWQEPPIPPGQESGSPQWESYPKRPVYRARRKGTTGT